MAIGSRKEVKAIRECKPQGISSYRAIEYVDISTHRGFVRVGDQILQGSLSCKGVNPIKEWIPQGIYQSRGLYPVGDYQEQGIGSYRAAKHVGISSRRGFIRVGDLFEQGISQSRGLTLLRPTFRRYKAASNRLESGLYVLWKFKARMGQWGVGNLAENQVIRFSKFIQPRRLALHYFICVLTKATWPQPPKSLQNFNSYSRKIQENEMLSYILC